MSAERNAKTFCRLIASLWQLAYLTLPSGWAGYYTVPALRPYQFWAGQCAMHPDVTKGHSNLWSLVGCEAEVGIKAKNSPATLHWWCVVWLFLWLEVHRLSADNRYRPIIGQFASVTNLRSYHCDFTIVTIWLLLNEDASWNKQSVIGRLFGADNRPKHYRCTSTYDMVCC